jgi:hypothetical protein
MALRELVASFGFGVDTSALSAADSAVGSISDSLLSMGKGVLAAFAVDAVFSFGRETLQIADALAKQAGALGVSTEQLQGWQHAAALSGSSAEEFTAALTKFTRNVNESGEAAAGPAAKAFKELGVTVKDASGKMAQPIDVLDGVVAGLEGIEDPAKRTALVMDLFGRSGARLLPLFSEGTEGIAKLRAEVQELGFGFDDAFLENAQEVNDNVDRLKMGLRGLAIQVIGPMLPDIVAMSKGAIAVAKSFVGWVKQTNVTRGVVTALGVKALPVLIAGMKTLGSIALRTVAPFLLLEDAVGWLAGDDSVIGDALDKLFGSGTGEAARKELLEWFTAVKNVVVNDLAPALASITDSALFRDVGKVALETVLGVLTLIGIALTDDAKKIDDLGERFLRNTNAIKEAFGFIDAIANIDKATIKTGLNDALDAVEGVVGGALGTETRIERDAKRRYDVQPRQLPALPGASAYFAPPEVVSGLPAEYKMATASVDYASAYRPTVATAPAPTSSYVDNSQTTIAPVATVNVTVEGGGGDEAVGNRIGKAAGKTIAGINLKAAKAALVPTPGG